MPASDGGGISVGTNAGGVNQTETVAGQPNPLSCEPKDTSPPVSVSPAGGRRPAVVANLPGRRNDILRQRESELRRVNHQLDAEREERERLEHRIQQLEKAIVAYSRSVPSPAPAPAVPVEPVVRSAAPITDVPSASSETAPAPSAMTDGVTVVHFDDQASCREALRAAAAKFHHVRYVDGSQFIAPSTNDRRLLAFNLLGEGLSFLPEAAESTDTRGEGIHALAYCADGAKGMVLGVLEFFPHPFDPEVFAARVLARKGTQRLLTVSEDVERLGQLRQLLGRAQCSASMVFDGRQALEMLPIVKPDMVLVDLSLPRAEGLRFIARLRAEASTADLAVGIFFSRPFDPADFAQQAVRLVRASNFDAADLGRALVHALGPGGVASRRDATPVKKSFVVRDHQTNLRFW
jgi:CheY-like chemotaxis protein